MAFKEVVMTTRTTKANNLFQDHIGNQIKTMATSKKYLNSAHDMPNASQHD
jgi:hypothetical protein